jgi:hypothetical protein
MPRLTSIPTTSSVPPLRDEQPDLEAQAAAFARE